MRILNEKVGRAFFNKRKATSGQRNIVNGYYMAKGASISTDGATLWSYWTPLAKWAGDKVIMTAHRYSNTTSRQQSDLRTLAQRMGITLEETAEEL